MCARINGTELAWTETGDGPPLVLIHGFPLDGAMWDAQVAALSARVRLIVPDLRGFGGSAPSAGLLRIETFADDVRALLDHLRIDRAVIGGLSMGGYVAFAFQRLHPERTRALLLCDTKAAADTPEAREGRAAMIRLVRAQGVAALPERMLPRLLASATLERRPDVVERIRSMILRAAPDGVAAALQAMADRADATPDLPSIRCPVLFVVGEHDAVSPPAEAEAICAQIPGARRVVIPDAGHMAPMENPGPVNAAIRGWLRGPS